MEKTERRALRKAVKKDGNRIGWSLIVYFLITFFTTGAWLVADLLISLSKSTDPTEKEAIWDEVFARFDKSGAYMILGVLLGTLFLFLAFRKQGVHRRIFHKESNITAGRFAAITCVFLSSQLLFQIFYSLMEAGLNTIGYTSIESMEMATSNSMSVSMFLYACIIGPIIEELVFRGFVMRSLEKYGSTLAIVVSSALFGIMHGNIPQGIFAFLIGLVLGFAAMKYSIVWSIILHILNNLVFAELFTRALELLPVNLQDIVYYAVMASFTVAGIIIVIVKRKKIVAFLRENKWQKPNLRWILTCSGILIYFAINLFLGITMISKL